MIALDEVPGAVTVLLHEALHGPEGGSSWFTDNRPGAGLLGSLDELSAAEASRPLAGSTIAAHAHHVLFGLRVSTAWVRGDRTAHDWSESWRVREVDDEAWRQLRAELREAASALEVAIAAAATSSSEALSGAVAAVAHVAAHLGAIRQKRVLLHESPR